MSFLPISKKDMEARGWTQCDFVYVIADAYVEALSISLRCVPAITASIPSRRPASGVV